MVKVVIYGVGNYFSSNRLFIQQNYDIVGYFDKNKVISEYSRVSVSDYANRKEIHFLVCSDLFEAEICNLLVDLYSIPTDRILILYDEIVRRKTDKHFFSYSQFGEDFVLHTLLKNLHYMTYNYLEIGVFDPIRQNNTYFLELSRGWNGYLIDADRRNIARIKSCRKRARIWNYAVVPAKTEADSNAIDFYISDNPGLSSCVADNIKMNLGKCIGKLQVPSITLNEVFDMIKKDLDVFSLDIEGLDEKVLLSTQFDVCRPVLLCAEIGNQYSNDLMEHMIYYGYTVAFQNRYNTIFQSRFKS